MDIAKLATIMRNLGALESHGFLAWRYLSLPFVWSHKSTKCVGLVLLTSGLVIQCWTLLLRTSASGRPKRLSCGEQTASLF